MNTLRIAGIMSAVLIAQTEAAEIKVLSTQATEAAYKELVPQFEKASGHSVKTVFTGTLDAQRRIAAGEMFDMIIMAGDAIDDYTRDGTLVANSRTNLAKSGVGVAVRAGAPKPDISTVLALEQTLLAAKSIGYSTGPSGIYLLKMLDRLDLTAEIKPKLKQTPTGVFVGTIIAKGEVEIGFQQVSELSQFPGVDFVGPLPDEVQQITRFASGIVAKAKEPAAAQELVKFISAPAASGAYTKYGLDPW